MRSQVKMIEPGFPEDPELVAEKYFAGVYGGDMSEQTFVRYEEKYVVIKSDDIVKYLTPHSLKEFNLILKVIGLGRRMDGKKSDERFVCVKQNEPWAEKVWELIEENVGYRTKED